MILIILIIIILALIGKYLWNTLVANAGGSKGLFTQVRLVDGISEIIGLYIHILVSLFLH